MFDWVYCEYHTRSSHLSNSIDLAASLKTCCVLRSISIVGGYLYAVCTVGPSVLPYLDTTISLSTTEDRCFTSKVFRKRTYTGLILNFSAICPQKWKFGLIQCLLHRAYTISSSWLTFSQEVHFLKGVFSQNGYPEDVFTSCLRRFVNNKCDMSIQNSKIKEDRVETIFFILYIGLPSIIFSQKLKELLKKYYCTEHRDCIT